MPPLPSQTFFTCHTQSQSFLLDKTLSDYIAEFPAFSVCLTELQKQGLLPDKTSITFHQAHFLTCVQSTLTLSLTPLAMLQNPFPRETLLELTQTIAYPKAFASLVDKMNSYIALIGDLLNNKLAQRNYDGGRFQENVSEKEHALQAGKMGFFVYGLREQVLALLLHDIARVLTDDLTHAHRSHAREGGIILSPLGLPTYSEAHAVPKYLLYKCCPSYRYLISELSEHTLVIQQSILNIQCSVFNTLDQEALAVAFYHLMVKRLIDDMSKVPTSILKEQLGEQGPEYFNEDQIKSMLQSQLSMHLTQQMMQGMSIQHISETMGKQLDAALLLMIQAKEYSNHPQVYEAHRLILEPFMKEQTATPS